MKVGDRVVYRRLGKGHVNEMREYIGQPGTIIVCNREDWSVVEFANCRHWTIENVDLEIEKAVVMQSIWEPDYDKYAVIDAETTVNAPEAYKFRASPAFPHNKVVAWGFTAFDTPLSTSHISSDPNQGLAINKPVLLVGHNIKFDLQYLAKQNKGHKLPAMPIWDTGVAHYMMVGQKTKMPSLNEVAEFYGLGQKEEGIKELWDMGVKTEDIEPEKLLSYLKQDVELTEKIYQAQMERLKELPKLRDHILRVSTASIFLGACELNGIPFNWASLYHAGGNVAGELQVAKEQLYEFAEKRYGIPKTSRDVWDPTTPAKIGRLLFDLPIEIEDWEPAGRVLKSGKISKKRRRIAVEYKPPEDELRKRADTWPVPKTGGGAISTNEETLDLMARARADIVPAIKTFREKSKLSGTYMEPTMEWCGATGVHTIHPSFHLTTTNTGRSSSSSPNAQQFPPELEKCLLPDRVGQYMVKADFKQLQICGVAMLSGDPQLIEDLTHGRDVHYETGKTVYKWTEPSQMNKEDRRVVKNTNFGLLFGGKAAGLAKQTGVDKKLVQKCIDAFFTRYPGVKAWVDKNIELVESIAQPAEGEFVNGYQVREAFLQTPAGRILRFVEREAPAWHRKEVCFSPNEIANYPVQGYTDGDLALIYLAILGAHPGCQTVWRPINFLHDAVWVLTDDPTLTKIQLTEALNELNTKMGLAVPLQLEFEVIDHNGNKVEETKTNE